MDWKKIFPLSLKAADNVTNFILVLLAYIIVPAIVAFVFGLLSFIPVLGIVLSIISWLFGIYCTVGFVLAILVFAKVIK